MAETPTGTAEVQAFNCTNCGAELKYKPGTSNLNCQYCGTDNEISIDDSPIEELDYLYYVDKLDNLDASDANQMSVNTIDCGSCGATTTLDSKVQSSHCPYCYSPVVIDDAHAEFILAPQSLIPFVVDENAVKTKVREWVSGLWFAPNKLKHAALDMGRLKGMYVPYWTYGSDTITQYEGQRGEDYTVQVPYTTTVDGKTVTRMRTEVRTNWYNTSGTVYDNFRNILVPASDSVDREKLNELSPWSLDGLVPFNADFLAGYNTEKYKFGLKDCFGPAQQSMYVGITMSIESDIGGDRQRINNRNTTYTNIMFKHVLLPVYVSSYMYKNKIYQIIANGQTGEILGDRPYSAWKITFFVLFIILIVAVIVFLVSVYG